MKLAVRIGLRGLGEFRGFCFQDDLNVRDGAMLRIVDDSADGSENGGVSCTTE
jgi:hypothetical protein